ncbi:hypothetical protein EJ04DRAFT_571932 [Polyplosphaeria fusca]|uniref:Zn(2)-C6 fungal-type domain-containing protein n=1 Tax=Polyplosphaeria fusca TaxID=682080 RepID=A0A9P4V778_9PLEO|nr:hypothetical protein EJ04DRAFT_571932 [Polyplosphaeria fusca]
MAEKRAEPALNRTCENCRYRKIKCIVSPRNDDETFRKCMRCSKLSLECAFAAPVVRKKRRRNEARIKELEEKLRGIETAVSRGQPSTEVTPSQSTDCDADPQSLESLQPWSCATASPPIDVHSSVSVEAGEAEALIHRFRSEMAPIYPLVHIPANWNAAYLRLEKPCLFWAILSAASSSIDPSMFETFFLHASRLVAEEVVVNGRKSIDLVQALLIMAAWHHPAERFHELKFSQYIHMAGTMIIDLRSSNDDQYNVPSPDRRSSPLPRTIVTCRTFLACYFLCSSISLTLRRQNPLQYGQWIDDCMTNLQAATTPNLADMRLVAWTRLQRIAEEGLTIVSFDRDRTIDYSDKRTRFVLATCIDSILTWRQQIADEYMTKPMEMHYNMILATLHEPALYSGHDMADFRPPYKLRSLPLTKRPFDDIPIDVAHSLDQCIASAEAITRSFIGLPIQVLRSVPVIIYARMAYAAVMLIKIDISVRSPLAAASLLHKEPATKEILQQLIERLTLATGPEHFLIPATFQGVLIRIEAWYVEHVDQKFFLDGQCDLIEPMKDLGVTNLYPVQTFTSSALQNSPDARDSDGHSGMTDHLWWDEMQEGGLFYFNGVWNDVNVPGQDLSV